MDANKLITKELEQKYQEQGLVRIQTHPTLDLKIINYSEKVTYENLWDENLLKYRALVYNSNYEVVAKSFDRFFNMEEEKHEATDDFEVFEKLDGSLILVFWYGGQMIVASRGSFTSPHALEAKRLLDEKYPKFEKYLRHLQLKNVTFCFELIGFEQIVVSYPVCDLVATGCFQDGKELSLNYATDGLLFDSVPIVKKFDGLDWKKIKELNWKNAEGFVVRFSNGQRCKIKFEEYIKLHRQMTNLSTRSIWQALANGEPVSSILGDVPDEFYEKVHEYEESLRKEYADLEADIRSRYLIEKRFYDNMINLHGLSEHDARKAFAERISKYPHRSAVFSMFNDKDCSKHIWKQIEPECERL